LTLANKAFNHAIKSKYLCQYDFMTNSKVSFFKKNIFYLTNLYHLIE